MAGTAGTAAARLAGGALDGQTLELEGAPMAPSSLTVASAGGEVLWWANGRLWTWGGLPAAEAYLYYDREGVDRRSGAHLYRCGGEAHS